jgi:PIN domain nuclease of toxin-antitoxin system
MISLAISFWEISISIQALRLHLSDMNEIMDENEG